MGNILDHMPKDYKGKDSPPCVVCGKPSVAWLVDETTGQKDRYCLECAKKEGAKTNAEGRPWAVVMRSDDKIKVAGIQVPGQASAIIVDKQAYTEKPEEKPYQAS